MTKVQKLKSLILVHFSSHLTYIKVKIDSRALRKILFTNFHAASKSNSEEIFCATSNSFTFILFVTKSSFKIDFLES